MCVVATAGMAGFFSLVDNFRLGDASIALMLSVTIGVSSYCVICWASGVRAFAEGLRTILNRRPLSAENRPACRLAR
jgi:hypothetical protein